MQLAYLFSVLLVASPGLSAPQPRAATLSCKNWMKSKKMCATGFQFDKAAASKICTSSSASSKGCESVCCKKVSVQPVHNLCKDWIRTNNCANGLQFNNAAVSNVCTSSKGCKRVCCEKATVKPVAKTRCKDWINSNYSCDKGYHFNKASNGKSCKNGSASGKGCLSVCCEKDTVKPTFVAKPLCKDWNNRNSCGNGQHFNQASKSTTCMNGSASDKGCLSVCCEKDTVKPTVVAKPLCKDWINGNSCGSGSSFNSKMRDNTCKNGNTVSDQACNKLCCEDDNVKPVVRDLFCSVRTNNGVCDSRGKSIDTGLECNEKSPNKCASSHCCKDDSKVENKQMYCDKSNNDGKCDSRGKTINKGLACNRHGSDKCASSHCCLDKKGSGSDQLYCGKDTNQGKCDRLGKNIRNQKKCNRHGSDKCASSHCCE